MYCQILRTKDQRERMVISGENSSFQCQAFSVKWPVNWWWEEASRSLIWRGTGKKCINNIEFLSILSCFTSLENDIIGKRARKSEIVIGQHTIHSLRTRTRRGSGTGNCRSQNVLPTGGGWEVLEWRGLSTLWGKKNRKWGNMRERTDFALKACKIFFGRLRLKSLLMLILHGLFQFV